MVKIKDSYNDDPLNIYFSKVGERHAEMVLEFDFPKDKVPSMTLTNITLDELLELRDATNEIIKRITGL